ncbi:transmembrane protein 268 [Pristis pectinata]|uniref:transmembrane protein 268 n=1 Tax=Pristis pectinata TaxID=685728 RepID=UPI00223E5234|nr:transmembrane protein 268 [Pristis pectinata]XP_051899836.1 transmembrane protein 268 [Pristis pectinata]XP_051899837.1 transmembrane protein 268 [Pristis pectinata]XP_051899838.1 transmembrane protein 268 [Pristis pectinata]XP_051899839.1 transmembrane protein 268 [Pristis pectinata]
MARDNGRESISPARTSLTSFEAVEEADIIHWINDPNGLGRLSRSSSANGPELYSASEKPELYNGRTLLVLTSSGPWWSRGFDLESCEEDLARFGIQIPPEDYKLPIQASLMSSEVRRYMYFSSSGFLMLLAPVFYLATWCCLFSTFHLYLSQYLKSFFWAFCLLISTVAVLLTTALLLILRWHNKKINVNTDVRLMWANENLAKHNILVGALDVTRYCTSVLHLCFIYFNIRECERRLASLLEARHHSGPGLQSFLHQKLGHLCIVIETSQVSPLNDMDAGSEEAPLLPGNGDGTLSNGSQQPQHVFNTLTCLVPKGTSEEIAYQLLVTYSGFYVKLLVMNQLPRTRASIHTEDAHIPCLCQYIETSILNLPSCESN